MPPNLATCSVAEVCLCQIPPTMGFLMPAEVKDVGRLVVAHQAAVGFTTRQTCFIRSSPDVMPVALKVRTLRCCGNRQQAGLNHLDMIGWKNKNPCLDHAAFCF